MNTLLFSFRTLPHKAQRFRWALLVFTSMSLGGCLIGGYGLNSASSGELAKVQSQCASLFNDSVFNSIRGKMVIGSDELPTREMVTLMESPTEGELAGIKRLEEADRLCKAMRVSANLPTTASEDIFAARVSKLRYGLYNGDIPYAVYNFGVAKALKEQAQFEFEGAVAFEKGKEIGRQRLLEDMQKTALKMRLDDIQSQLNNFDASY